MLTAAYPDQDLQHKMPELPEFAATRDLKHLIPLLGCHDTAGLLQSPADSRVADGLEAMYFTQLSHAAQVQVHVAISCHAARVGQGS